MRTGKIPPQKILNLICKLFGGQFIDDLEVQKNESIKHLIEMKNQKIEELLNEKENLINKLSSYEKHNQELMATINKLKKVEFELKEFKEKFNNKKNHIMPKFPSNDSEVNKILKWEDEDE
ncbi:hypothetical protein KZO01_21590 [Kurthia zopfii]|uniref:Uncharacterized protein n=1 Tax=Kurthia zopfii TaxID=1650 RepID=A0A8B4QCX5_9BACL|nr:hypothetical protein [Kurthia zopfii]PWI21350.1 hypothetical protein DF281_12620 [Kurthia zopfii]TDR34350.1 hypothetical protein DFR61_1405 [Kurthia zopfii]GEK31850.1 hypothetical protein KZO01_21590 [Kurthia zopfii]STX10542.1 Uncharacterised protein [Kurthia zopfii]